MKLWLNLRPPKPSCAPTPSAMLVATSWCWKTIEVTLVNPGCTDSAACNYDDDANIDDESCEFCSCGQNACGCTDPEACNYDDANEYEDGSCTYPENDCVVGWLCITPTTTEFVIVTSLAVWTHACNYDEDAEDGSCDCSCD